MRRWYFWIFQRFLEYWIKNPTAYNTFYIYKNHVKCLFLFIEFCTIHFEWLIWQYYKKKKFRTTEVSSSVPLDDIEIVCYGLQDDRRIDYHRQWPCVIRGSSVRPSHSLVVVTNRNRHNGSKNNNTILTKLNRNHSSNVNKSLSRIFDNSKEFMDHCISIYYIRFMGYIF